MYCTVFSSQPLVSRALPFSPCFAVSVPSLISLILSSSSLSLSLSLILSVIQRKSCWTRFCVSLSFVWTETYFEIVFEGRKPSKAHIQQTSFSWSFGTIFFFFFFLTLLPLQFLISFEFTFYLYIPLVTCSSLLSFNFLDFSLFLSLLSFIWSHSSSSSSSFYRNLLRTKWFMFGKLYGEIGQWCHRVSTCQSNRISVRFWYHSNWW